MHGHSARTGVRAVFTYGVHVWSTRGIAPWQGGIAAVAGDKSKQGI
jgi:hypothetical protein